MADACWDVKGILACARRLKVKFGRLHRDSTHFDQGYARSACRPANSAGDLRARPAAAPTRACRWLHEMAADGATPNALASEVARVAAQCQLAEGEIAGAARRGGCAPIGAHVVEVAHAGSLKLNQSTI